MLVAALTAMAATCANAALTARNYVMDGLIAHWDGEYNVGYTSEHSTSATPQFWRELTGNGPDMTLPTDSYFTSNALVSSRAYGSPSGGNSGKQYYAAKIINAFSNANITVETAFDMDEANSGMCRFFVLGSDGFWQGTYGSTQAGWIANGDNGTDTGRTTGINSPIIVDSVLGKHTLSCSQGPNNTGSTTSIARLDELEPVTHTLTPRATPDQSRRFRFNRGWNEGGGLQGRYHSIRIYDRALTAEETAVNRAVDRVRFFNGDPAMELPDGWRFNTEDGVALESRSSASVSDAGFGTVSVNGGEAGESVEMWVEYNGVSTVTLSATPSDGYNFRRWDGAIESGDVKKATGTFTVSGPVRAVFRKTTGVIFIMW